MINEYKLLKGYTSQEVLFIIALEEMCQKLDRLNESLVKMNKSLESLNETLRKI